MRCDKLRNQVAGRVRAVADSGESEWCCGSMSSGFGLERTIGCAIFRPRRMVMSLRPNARASRIASRATSALSILRAAS